MKGTLFNPICDLEINKINKTLLCAGRNSLFKRGLLYAILDSSVSAQRGIKSDHRSHHTCCSFYATQRQCAAQILKEQKRALSLQFLMNPVQGSYPYFSSLFVLKQMCPHMFSCHIQMLQLHTHVLNKLWT